MFYRERCLSRGDGRLGGGRVQVEDADGRVAHCDVDSMDLGLLIGVHFKIGRRNVV